MKLLLLCALFLSTFNAFSSSSFPNSIEEQKAFPFCSLLYAKSVKKKLVKGSTVSDKYKHCAVSCMLANRCGELDAIEIGIYKELWDLISPGDADWKDLEADLIGIQLSSSQSAINDNECNNECLKIDWSQLKK